MRCGRWDSAIMRQPPNTLVALLDNRHPQEIQLAVLETFGKFDDPAVGEILTEDWPRLSPRLRAAAGDVLFSRPQWLTTVLDAIDGGRLSLADLDPARLKLLESHSQPEIRERVKKLIASLKASPRQEVLAAYQPALTLAGQPARGRTYFQKICSSCHRLEGVGNEVGPSLAAIKNRGAETIFLNLLDPNREVNPQYVNYVAVLDDGRILSGMIASETATAITLRRAENATDTDPARRDRGATQHATIADARRTGKTTRSASRGRRDCLFAGHTLTGLAPSFSRQSSTMTNRRFLLGLLAASLTIRGFSADARAAEPLRIGIIGCDT